MSLLEQTGADVILAGAGAFAFCWFLLAAVVISDVVESLAANAA